MEKSDRWAYPLDLEGKDAQVIGTDHQVLFSCQEPGVPYRWTQIVHNGGNIYAARVLPIIVPESLSVTEGASFLKIIHTAGPENCLALMVHETRPYPALIRDYPGTSLCNMPGGVVMDSDVSIANGGIREFLEELGADPAAILAHLPLVSVPMPASAAAQLEGHYLHCLAYRGNTKFRVAAEESITGVELIPLRKAYHLLKQRHEAKKECTESKTLLALLMLQQEYLEAYGVPLFSA